MSNLAYKVKHNYQSQEQQAPSIKPNVKKRANITLGEKCLAVLFGAALLFGGVEIISNQIGIYKTNIEIQKIEATMGDQTKLNSDLLVQVQELSTYERIWAKARELGLVLNENNVKVVQDGPK